MKPRPNHPHVEGITFSEARKIPINRRCDWAEIFFFGSLAAWRPGPASNGHQYAMCSGRNNMTSGEEKYICRHKMEGLRESNRFAVDFFGYETIARAKVEPLFVYQPSKPRQFYSVSRPPLGGCCCLGRRRCLIGKAQLVWNHLTESWVFFFIFGSYQKRERIAKVVRRYRNWLACVTAKEEDDLGGWIPQPHVRNKVSISRLFFFFFFSFLARANFRIKKGKWWRGDGNDGLFRHLQAAI